MASMFASVEGQVGTPTMDLAERRSPPTHWVTTWFGAGRRVRAIPWPVTSDIGTFRTRSPARGNGRLRFQSGLPQATSGAEPADRFSMRVGPCNRTAIDSQ